MLAAVAMVVLSPHHCIGSWPVNVHWCRCYKRSDNVVTWMVMIRFGNDWVCAVVDDRGITHAGGVRKIRVCDDISRGMDCVCGGTSH